MKAKPNKEYFIQVLVRKNGTDVWKDWYQFEECNGDTLKECVDDLEVIALLNPGIPRGNLRIARRQYLVQDTEVANLKGKKFMREVYMVYRYDYPYTNVKIMHGCYATVEMAQRKIDEIVRLRKNMELYKHYEPEDYVHMEALEVIE